MNFVAFTFDINSQFKTLDHLKSLRHAFSRYLILVISYYCCLFKNTKVTSKIGSFDNFSFFYFNQNIKQIKRRDLSCHLSCGM